MSDDFPTPKAVPPTASSMSTLCFPVEHRPASPASSDTQSDRSSLWSKRSSNTDFDEMYDLSPSESEDVPIKLSSSVKRRVAATRRYPSIAIPSPSQWPTVQKLQSASALSPAIKVQLSPAILEQFQNRSHKVPSTSSAPSLDGSMTSDELGLSSCPSTPDIVRQQDSESQWEAPAQLDPSAFSVLQQITGEDDRHSETVIEVPEEAAQEMREIVESPRRLTLQVQTSSLAPSTDVDADEELSALSVPSPGGFFSSLNTTLARRTWCGAEVPNTSTAAEFYGVPFKTGDDSALPTSTATSFYGVPWQVRPENPVEHMVSIASPQNEKADPITARRSLFSPGDGVQEVNEIDENYDDALRQTAAVNINRTQLWLSTQKAYIASVLSDDDAVVDSFKDIDGAVPKTPDRAFPSASDSSPSSKKSVRFVDALLDDQAERKQKRVSPIHDGTFWDGFRHTKRSQRARDVFQHRQMRAEAEQVMRTSAGKAHADQLRGHFEITSSKRPSTSRPISEFLETAPEDEQKKEVIARAERERQALEQLHPSAWHLEAQKELNGGRLLTSPIVATFKNRKDVKILDIAGQAHCSWAWDVAVTHPKATVYTTVSSDVEAHIASTSLDGPNNHIVVAAPKTWDLPFEDNTFDVISARNMYANLKTLTPPGEVIDEWDLTLRDCLRVLKPGGYLEFDLLDAELMHPEAAAQALGVEFAFKLKTRGYDPCSGKNFLPRLKRAGFKDIKRAWMVLPVADVAPRWTDAGKTPSSSSTITAGPESVDYFGAAGLATPECYPAPVTGSTKDVRAITGLVGSRAWEQWMLKLDSDMGRSDERCLEGVARALEESGRANAGWRCLVGWAKKAI